MMRERERERAGVEGNVGVELARRSVVHCDLGSRNGVEERASTLSQLCLLLTIPVYGIDICVNVNEYVQAVQLSTTSTSIAGEESSEE